MQDRILIRNEACVDLVHGRDRVRERFADILSVKEHDFALGDR